MLNRRFPRRLNRRITEWLARGKFKYWLRGWATSGLFCGLIRWSSEWLSGRLKGRF